MTMIAAGYTLAPVAVPASAPARPAVDAIAHKADIQAAAAKSLQNGRFKPTDTLKQLARAKVTELVERVRLLKKLFSANPREMAKALAQVFKELKAAVSAYRHATGDEMKLAGDIAMPPAPPASAPASGAPEAAGPEPAAAESKSSQAPVADEAAAALSQTAPDAAAGYGAVTQQMRESIGEDALTFAKEVRELAHTLRDLLEAARGESRSRRPSRETQEAFDDADKALHGLHEGLDTLEQDVRHDAPTIGLILSVAA